MGTDGADNGKVRNMLKNSGDVNVMEKTGDKKEDPGSEACVQNGSQVKQQAEEKLKKEMEEAKDKTFAEPVINFLLERCREDEGLAEDVMQEHKTWQKCFDYICSKASEQAEGNCAAVRDAVVYEWAEDYYHRDDKAEEERKARKTARGKNKKAKSAVERKTKKEESTVNKTEKVPAPAKARKNGKEMDGQLDMFAMMGLQEGEKDG